MFIPIFLEILCRLFPLRFPLAARFGLIEPGLCLPPGLVDDPIFLWRARPGARLQGLAARLNRLGLRGPVPERPKPAGRMRIAVVGGSVAFGQGIAESRQVYASIVARLIEEDAKIDSVDWVLGALPGYSSYQAEKLLEEVVLPLEPDIVILAFGLDDRLYSVAGPDRSVAKAREGQGWFSHALSALTCRSALLGRIRTEIARSEGSSTRLFERIPPRRVDPDTTARLLARAITRSQASRCRCLVIGIAARPELPYVLNPVFVGDPAGFRSVSGRSLAGRSTRSMVSPPVAMDILRDEIHRHPELPLPVYLAGRLLESLGDPEARVYLDRARRLDRERPAIGRYNRLLRREAEAAGVPFIDPARLWPDNREGAGLFLDERLINSEGHARLAAEVARRIRAEGWLGAEPARAPAKDD